MRFGSYFSLACKQKKNHPPLLFGYFDLLLMQQNNIQKRDDHNCINDIHINDNNVSEDNDTSVNATYASTG